MICYYRRIFCGIFLLCFIFYQNIFGSEKLSTHTSHNATSEVWFSFDHASVNKRLEPVYSHLSDMLEQLITGVTATKNFKEAWLSLVKPSEKIGIKVSTLPGSIAGTHPEIVTIIVQQLIMSGIPSKNIFVWDCSKENLVACGFQNIPNIHLCWIPEITGFDAHEKIQLNVPGQLIYGDYDFQKKSTQKFEEESNVNLYSDESHLPTIVSNFDKIIHIPSLCDSHYTGIHGAFADMIIGVLDNWRRFGEKQFGGFALAEAYSDPRLGRKVILTIMDGLVLQYAGGPEPNPSHSIPLGLILCSEDAVALDTVALTLIDEQRKLYDMPKASHDATYLSEANQNGLGNNNLTLIQLKRVGPKNLTEHNNQKMSHTIRFY